MSFVVRSCALLWAATLLVASVGSHAADKLTLQLKWLPQAQFAGYYVALSKGYYAAEGLDVTIRPGGPDNSPEHVIASRGADVIVSWLPIALAAREAGVPLVNIAQIFNRSGLMLVCRRASGIKSPKDFKGKTLGVWYEGSERPFLNWMAKLGYRVNVDLKIIKQGFNVEPLLQKQADCISAMNYNEYGQLLDAGLKESELITFFYEDMGVATLEDGLYVLESKLADPAFTARMGKFLKATFKGWNAAIRNPAEAARIVVSLNPQDKLDEKLQRRQMQSVVKLISTAGTARMGYLDPAAFDRTVRVLLAAGNTNVIRHPPDKTAYSHALWQAAQK